MARNAGSVIICDILKQIHDYRLYAEIRSGTQARIFRAEKEGRFFALKLFPQGETKQARLEAEALEALRHSNVARYVEFGCSSEGPYLITEWVEGESLDHADVPVKWEELRQLILGILAGLKAIHDGGFIHGDVKGSNILIDAAGAKLVDLGFAQRMEKVESVSAGTLAHLAPELLFGKSPSPSSDLYALGMTLYRWLHGAYPFPLNSASEVLRWQILGNPLHPAPKGPWPLALGDFVLSLLAKSPADRPRHVDEVLLRFQSLFGVEVIYDSDEDDEDGFEFYGEAIRYYESKAELSGEEGLILAELYHRQGYPAKALQVLQFSEEAEAALLRGKAFTRMGDFAGAERSFREFEASKVDPSPGLRLSLLNARGVLNYYLGKVSVAGEAFAEAEACSRRIGELAPLAVAYNNLANVLLEKGEVERAEEYFRRSLELSRESGDRVHEGMFQMSLGYFFHRLGKSAEAIASYEEAIQLLEALGQKSEAARARLNRANLILSLGDLLGSERDLKSAQKVFKRRGLRYLAAYSQQIEGEILRKHRRPKEAAKVFRSSGAELSELNREGDFRWALLHEAECLLESGEIEMARRRLEEAEVLPNISKDLRAEGHLFFLRGRLEWTSGASPELILKNFDAAASRLEKCGDQEAGILLNYARGAYERSLGKNSEAKLRLQSALSGLQVLAERIPAEWRLRYLENSPRAEIERMLKNMESIALPSGETAPPGDEVIERAFRELQKESVGELDLSSLVEKILDRMIEVTRAERGFILLKEEPSPRIVVSRNIDHAKLRKASERISWSIASEVLEKGRPLVTVDALEDSRFSVTASIHQLKLRSIICLPLKAGPEVLGAIYLDNRERRSAFQPGLAAALNPFADWMGQVLSNARRFFEVQSDLNRTKQRLEAAESELKIKYDYKNIVGRHSKMLEIFQVLDRVTDVEVPVLILGESGVGKERLAKAIHFNGARAARAFVSLNCQAVPEGLFESELFGHIRGSFTGASSDRVGLVEQAHRGTLFLDEIGDMPLGLQGKLLRVLQEGKFRPVGAKEEKPADCRVLAATHQDLRAMIKAGRFREDLWFRLNVVEIQVPALRERMEDLPLLADHFLSEFAKRHGGKKKRLDAKALELLGRYAWPGNVRELENTLTNACVFAEGESLKPEAFRYKRELFEKVTPTRIDEVEIIDKKFRSFREAQQEFEKRLIAAALEKSRGNITHAAIVLKVARPQLSRLIKKYKLSGV